MGCTGSEGTRVKWCWAYSIGGLRSTTRHPVPLDELATAYSSVYSALRSGSPSFESPIVDGLACDAVAERSRVLVDESVPACGELVDVERVEAATTRLHVRTQHLQHRSVVRRERGG